MSMYRKDRGGFDKLAPDEVEDRWNGRGLSRFTPAAEGRRELRQVKRGVERGWGIGAAVKDRCVTVVMETLEDGSASARDKLTAVGAVVAMVRTDAAIDARTAAGPHPDPDPATVVVEYVDDAAEIQTD